MTKQVVHYRAGSAFNVHVGQRASVIPLDHPDTVLVENGYTATTSRVVSYDANTGEFETLNSLYKPVTAQQ